jgi:hypothetical protein
MSYERAYGEVPLIHGRPGACAQDAAFALQAGGRDLVLTVIMMATVAFVLAPLVSRTLTRWLLR